MLSFAQYKERLNNRERRGLEFHLRLINGGYLLKRGALDFPETKILGHSKSAFTQWGTIKKLTKIDQVNWLFP